jgi:RNA polymerase sigma-70 factor (ECF subfamily)
MIRLISESALVAQCKAGDHGAFTELIRRSSPVATHAIRAIVRNPTDLEDVMQDALLKAYRGGTCFNEQCKLSTWLTRIAINSALMHLRVEKIGLR